MEQTLISFELPLTTPPPMRLCVLGLLKHSKAWGTGVVTRTISNPKNV